MTRIPAMALACALLAPAAGAAAEWAPPGWSRAPAAAAPVGPTNPAAVALGWLVRGYQETASRVDGDRCPSYPTCSQYALQALRQHGPLLGTALTAGRLLSEADEAAFAARIHIGGHWRVYSPLADDLAFIEGPLAP